MPSRFTVVGLGEALYDIYPDKQVLGGAPLNVAVHAHQLAAPVGGRGVVVSRIGQDDLGTQLLRDIAARGMTTDYLQTDPDRDTGKVYVGSDDQGQPTYDIVSNVAWDVLQFDPDLESLAQRCEAVCFGSLAQRDAQTRNTMFRFLTAAGRAVRLFDVNLRQHYHDRRTLERSGEASTAIKLNHEELPQVIRELGLGPADAQGADSARHDQWVQLLLRRFELRLVVLTRGQLGTVLYTPQGRYEGAPASYTPAAGADAVGAGDACSAAVLVGLLLRWPLQRVADVANQVGAYVASQPGATPALPSELLQEIHPTAA